MGLLSDNKPYTAVTANIERLVSEEYPEDDVVEIIELVEIINIRPTGPTEAARALRKKLKYGNTHNKLRALTILDALIQNGGKQMSGLYRDANLLERLRLTATETTVDDRVKRKMKALFYGWSQDLKGVPGCEDLTRLYNELPQRTRRAKPPPKYLHDSEEEEDRDHDHDHDSRVGSSSRRRRDDAEDAPVSSSRRIHSRHGSTSSPFNRSRSNSLNDSPACKSKRKPAQRLSKADLAKERPRIQQVLAEANTAATNLNNALKLVNRELELATENEHATRCFKRCKVLRRQVLKYIHSIVSEDYLGSLIHANEELVTSLQLYDVMSQPDSDSEKEDWKVDRRMRKLTLSDEGETESEGSEQEQSPPAAVPKRRPPPPISPKPAHLRGHVKESDEENPFADSHVDESVPEMKPKW